jgi:acyl-CoA reductase-like NAD-dependent aldehyde dehydrogenase
MEAKMHEAVMTIGGKPIRTTRTFGVINPATGNVFAEAPDCSKSELDEAMGAAEGAFRTWRSNEEARRAGLYRAAKALTDARAELAALLTAEQGKPLATAASEVDLAAQWLRVSAGLALPREVVQDDATAYAEVVRRPLGVVAAITPWNFPLLLAAWKIGPALIAGNTVILKPSPFTPLTTLNLGALLASQLPPGVLNVVSGGDELGAWMTSHPAVRKISLTGSVATGKAVAAAAAPDLKRVTLELGGNDAAIVLDDANPAVIADGMFWGAFMNCGQVCAAIKRVYVPEALHDDLVEALAERARKVQVGEGTRKGVQLGPVNNRPQYERIKELVNDTFAAGGKAAAGGKPIDGDGYFFEPTILTDVSDGMRIVDEEQFGPVLPIIPYRSLDDAIERANATHFGLCGSVWSSDVDRASEVSRRLECGTAYVNAHIAIAPHLPFGGMKWSGIGVENGQWGLDEFTNLQVLYQSRA